MSIKIPKTIPSSKLKNSRQLIKWINKLVGVNYYKLEDCKNGVAYCRVMNKLFPSVLSLSKINQMPTQDFEINRNYKVLQTAFQKIGVRKPIEISQLVKGKKAILKSSTNKKSALLKKRAKNLKPLNKKTKARPTRKDQQKSTSRLRPRSDSLADPRRNKRTRLNSKANSVELNKLKSQIEKLKKEIDDKKEQIEYKGKKIKNCQDAVVSLHKDVKYYYGKLLKIEKLCTSLKNQYPILDQVLDEIYSSDEENDNDEEIVENESNSDYDDEEEDSDDSVSDDSEVEYEK